MNRAFGQERDFERARGHAVLKLHSNDLIENFIRRFSSLKNLAGLQLHRGERLLLQPAKEGDSSWLSRTLRFIELDVTKRKAVNHFLN